MTPEGALPVVGTAAMIVAGILPPVCWTDTVVRQHTREVPAVTIGAGVAGLATVSAPRGS